MSERKQAKRVCVVMSQQDYERLSQLAWEACRTASGYMRWLLHQHFKKLDAENTSDKK